MSWPVLTSISRSVPHFYKFIQTWPTWIANRVWPAHREPPSPEDPSGAQGPLGEHPVWPQQASVVAAWNEPNNPREPKSGDLPPPRPSANARWWERRVSRPTGVGGRHLSESPSPDPQQRVIILHHCLQRSITGEDGFILQGVAQISAPPAQWALTSLSLIDTCGGPQQ